MTARTGIPALAHIPPLYAPWLGARSSSAGFEIAGPPEFAMRRARFDVRVTPPTDVGAVEYRLGTMFQPRYPAPNDKTDWRYDDPWSEDTVFPYRAERSGVIGFHIQARSASEGALLLDAWIGQTTVYEPTEIAALSYLPMAHLAICAAPESGLEDAATSQHVHDLTSLADLAEFFKSRPRERFADWAAKAGFAAAEGLLASLSFVSNLWAYGNEDDRSAVEIAPGRHSITIAEALAAPAANCAEFAAMQALLIEALGLGRCRSAHIDGHVMVQAHAESGTWLLCPTTGFAIRAGINKMISGDAEPGTPVIVFANRGLQRESPRYRPNFMAFRHYLIAGLAARSFTPYDLRQDWRAFLPLAAKLTAGRSA